MYLMPVQCFHGVLRIDQSGFAEFQNFHHIKLGALIIMQWSVRSAVDRCDGIHVAATPSDYPSEYCWVLA